MPNLSNAFKKIDKLTKRIEQVAQGGSGPHTHPIGDIAALQNKLDQIDSRMDGLEDRIWALEHPAQGNTKP